MDARTVATKYFESWKVHDFSTFRSLLADDVTFVGPMGTAGNAEECVEGIEGMSKFVIDIVIQKMWVDGPDVITCYVTSHRQYRTIAHGQLEPHRERQSHQNPGDIRSTSNRAAFTLTRRVSTYKVIETGFSREPERRAKIGDCASRGIRHASCGRAMRGVGTERLPH